MEPKVTQGLQALGFFKDWTNYLLVQRLPLDGSRPSPLWKSSPSWLSGKTKHSRLKVPCWPQHVFFLAGIILFCVEHHW